MREARSNGLSLRGSPPLRNHLKPIEILSQDQLMAIHEASLHLLENIGIEFMGAGARRKFREAGAKVDDSTGLVKIPRNVATGEHFFGAEHTLARYETAFYQPLVSNWQNYETWDLAGHQDATQRATAIWQNVMATYEQPSMDPAVREALEVFVARRKEELRSVEH